MTTTRPRPDTRPKPKAIREPQGSGLLAWFRSHAAERGISWNGAMVLALQRYRDEETGTTAQQEPPQQERAS